MTKTTNINIRINSETETAIKEARDIMNGHIQAKRYSSAHALFEELDSEKETTYHFTKKHLIIT